MQPSKASSHGVKVFFAERAFDAREYFVFLKANMIVEKFREASHCCHRDGQLLRAQTLKIQHYGANLRMLGEQANDSRILIQPRVACISRQQHFFLFAKMNDAGLVPERDEFLCLPLNSRVTLFSRSFSCAPHLQSLNQRKVMMLAQRMQTRMVFHADLSMVNSYHSRGSRGDSLFCGSENLKLQGLRVCVAYNLRPTCIAPTVLRISLPASQPSRAGLRSVAPPALRLCCRRFGIVPS